MNDCLCISEVSTTVPIDPNNKIALYNRGRVYLFQDEWSKAFYDNQKAISIDNNFSFAYRNRGLARYQLGQKELGCIDLQKSLDIDDTDKEKILKFIKSFCN